MPIVITIDGVLAARKRKAKELAAAIGVSETHLSLFRSGKVRGVRFSTLAKLCAALDCQPGDLLAYQPDPNDLASPDEGEE
ncbi:MAG: helix-turn-helix transcriptional regulator [Acidobacteria bacterium]|nr:helix-turn-helix transcriptional regulator [Acidobacteriota bacterium]MBV9478583.1 helix-turn-helix transcriptional regulator [Acidobacteriota bacterium]